ncbi:hypothetical protein BH11ARM2_BH11ARM2_04510 [soil metagenome]
MLSAMDVSDASFLAYGKWMRYASMSGGSLRVLPNCSEHIAAFWKDWLDLQRAGVPIAPFSYGREPIECGTTDFKGFSIGGEEGAKNPSNLVLSVSLTEGDEYRFGLRFYDQAGLRVAGNDLIWEPPVPASEALAQLGRVAGLLA